MTNDPVDAALDTLERSLRGPRRARTDMVREVRHGLDDAVAGYREAGLAHQEAQRRALHEFGDMRLVASGLQAELTARYGRRSALLLALVFPGLVLLWDSLWITSAVPMRPATPSAALLADLIDTLSLASALGCVAALVVLCLGARQPVPLHRVTQGIGVLALVTLAGTGGLATALNLQKGAESARMFDVPLAVCVLLANLVAGAWVFANAVRCLRLGRAEQTASNLQ